MATGSNSNRRYVDRDEFDTLDRRTQDSIASVARAVDSLAVKVDSLYSRGTDWKAIFSGLSLLAAVIMAIGGLVSYGITTRVGSLETVLRKVELKTTDRFTRTAHDRFRDRLAQRIEKQQERDASARKALDDGLQREMRLLDDALQREMRMLLNAPLERLKQLEDKVGTTQRRFDRSDFEKYTLPRLEALSERVRNLEISHRGGGKP